MQVINEKEIISNLKSHNNEIFMVMTPWHAKSIEATYLKYKQTDSSKPLVICMHIKNKPLAVFENSFTTLSEGAEFFEYTIKQFDTKESIFDFIKTFIKFICKPHRKETIYLYTTRGISIYIAMKLANDINGRIVNIISDEGLATSYDKFHLSIKNIFKSIINGIVKLKIKVIDDTLLRKENGRLYTNDDLVKRYLTVLKDKNFNAAKMFVPTGRYVLLCYAPINEELVLVEENQFKEIVQSVVDILRQNDIEIVIKLHPRENNEDFYKNMGCILWNNGLSIESLLANINNRPIFIMGSISTALVTSKIFFDIEGVSTLKLYDSRSDEFEKLEKGKYVTDFERFSSLYGKYIKFPDNHNEMLQYINLIINSDK